MLDNDVICPGAVLLVVEPSPSSPEELPPHVHTLPSDCVAIVW
jgi:hypothetical protein